MSRTRSLTKATTAASLAATAMLLAGCSGSGLAPGDAAVVGDERITNERVNQMTHALCVGKEDQIRSANQSVPLSLMRQSVVAALAQEAMARQIADHYGLKPGTTYNTQMANLRVTSAALPADVRDDYIALQGSVTYADDILNQAATKKLADDGVKDPSAEAVQAAGEDLLRAWPGSHKIVFDPRYNIGLNKEGVLTQVTNQLSMPVSDFATKAQDFQKNPEFAFQLPQNQTCGA